MRLTRESFTLPRAIEPDVEIVAIGDIHGRSDLFGELLDAAATTRVQARTRRLVLLGDLVDRGPDSLGALALARRAGERIGARETIGLFGNHEILMRMTLDREIPERAALGALQVWLSNGGDRVVEELFGFDADWSDLRELLLALRETVPQEIAGWLGGLKANYRSGEVLFVHAGVNPAFPLESFLAQAWDARLAGLKEAAHWAWVRGPFLDHKPGERGFSGYFVVHGHTPLDRGHTRGHAEQAARFRLNLDGGSAVTGMAKMAVLRGGVAEVISVMDEAPA